VGKNAIAVDDEIACGVGRENSSAGKGADENECCEE
jgi:hypothetical protein